MKFAVRADASVQSGAGHVMRCLSLADALRGRGAEVLFICRALEGQIGDVIRQSGYRLTLLPPPERFAARADESPPGIGSGAPWRRDAEETIAAIPTDSPRDWLIVDHYGLDFRWESSMRRMVRKIMVIDDLADRRHDCDLLLDQNVYRDMHTRYEKLVPPGTKQLLGPKYALLRKEFEAKRGTPRVRDGSVRRVLVSFGATDPKNLTTRVLEALKSPDQADICIDVVVGRDNPHIAAIEGACANLENTRLIVQARNMAELIEAADLAIGAGGTATWERCALGLPSIIVSVVEHQDAIAEAVAESGAALWLGNVAEFSANKLLVAMRRLLTDKDELKRISQRAAQLVDGKGATAVAELLRPSN